MARAFILLFDSFGIGASFDADKYGDSGANTLLHIAEYCAEGKGDREGLRKGFLKLPNLTRLGLNAAAIASAGESIPGLEYEGEIGSAFGYAVERSKGKDTPSGHWEIAGVPVLFDWGYFSFGYPTFPDELIQAFIKEANIPGILGNTHASGTTIIEQLGEEHIKTGKPIVYTSSDSVFQIAAHEHYFGLEKLYEISAIARKLVDAYNIGRVIARPFLGEPGQFYRTGNRKDLATPPPEATLLDKIIEEKGEVITIGKVADIFAHQGISQTIKADGNMALFDTTLKVAQTASDKSLIFTNFVDFDMLFGHRRDVPGYAAALEVLDTRLPELEKVLKDNDIVIITADHGCDPTLAGSDHTREHIPVLIFGPRVKNGFIGRRDSFADIGQTIAHHLGIKSLNNGIRIPI